MVVSAVVLVAEAVVVVVFVVSLVGVVLVSTECTEPQAQEIRAG